MRTSKYEKKISHEIIEVLWRKAGIINQNVSEQVKQCVKWT